MNALEFESIYIKDLVRFDMGEEIRGYDSGRRDFLKTAFGVVGGLGLYGCSSGGESSNRGTRERDVRKPTLTVNRKFGNDFDDIGKVQLEYFASDDSSIIDEVHLKYNGERGFSVFPVIGQDPNGRLRFSSTDDAIKKLITSSNNTYETFVRNRNRVDSDILPGEFNVLEREAAVSVIHDILHARGVFNNDRYSVEFKGDVSVQVGTFIVDVDYVIKNRENGRQSIIRAVGFGVGEKLQHALDQRVIARRDGRYHSLYVARAPRELVIGEVNRFIKDDFVDRDRNVHD